MVRVFSCSWSDWQWWWAFSKTNQRAVNTFTDLEISSSLSWCLASHYITLRFTALGYTAHTKQLNLLKKLSAFYLVFQTHLCDSLSRNSHASKHERARHSKVCIRHFLNMKRSILSLSDSLVFYVKKQKYKCLRRKTSPPRSSNITSVRPVRFSLICHFSTAIYTLIPTRYKNKTFLK